MTFEGQGEMFKGDSADGPLEKEGDLGRELQLFSSWQHPTTGGAVPNLAVRRQYNNRTADSDKTHLHTRKMPALQNAV